MLAKTMGIVLVAWLGSERTGGAGRHDDVGRERTNSAASSGESIIPSFCPSVLDGDVVALNMAEFTELLPECFQDMPLQGR